MRDLVENFPSGEARISRVLFSRPDWDSPAEGPWPRRLPVAHGVVKLGSFPEDDTHAVILVLSTRERLHLRVVDGLPPQDEAGQDEAGQDEAAADEGSP